MVYISITHRLSILYTCDHKNLVNTSKASLRQTTKSRYHFNCDLTDQVYKEAWFVSVVPIKLLL